MKGGKTLYYGMMNKMLAKSVHSLASMYQVWQNLCFFCGQSIKGLWMLSHGIRCLHSFEGTIKGY